MMNKYAGDERRKNPRLNANFVISYRIKQHQGTYDLSQSKNVSKSGILLTTNKAFESGTHLAMTIRFPFVPQRIEVVGEVIDSREVVKNLIYETRIIFQDLDSKFMEELGEFIQKRLK
jgi:hypothetical protein